MAVTKIIPIRSTIEKSVAYICNPDKTDGGILTYSEHCFPQTAGPMFQHYLSMTRAGGNTQGRHLIQSFAPGEVTAETAHEIGKKLAAEILQGHYAFVLSTHVDRGHIHNHFVWCAADVFSHKKYRSNKGTYHAIRKASDRLCEENSLSVIVPSGYGEHYITNKKEQPWRSRLRILIDSALERSSGFEDFVLKMKAAGLEVKRGKHIAFKATRQEKFTRAKSLGAGYSEDEIRERIEKKNLSLAQKEVPEKTAPARMAAPPLPSASPPPEAKTANAPPTASKSQNSLGKLVDIEAKKQEGKGEGYEQWAKVHNLKVSAATLIALEKYGNYESFDRHFGKVVHAMDESRAALNASEERIKKLSALSQTLGIYRHHRPVFNEYVRSEQKKTFLKTHGDEVQAFRDARAQLENVPKPYPTAKALADEIAKLKSALPELKTRYKKHSDEMKQMQPIQRNVYDFFRQYNKTSPKRAQEER